MGSGKGHENKPDVETDLNTPNGAAKIVDPLTRDDRFVVHIPVSSSPTSSASAERKVDDLFRQVFRGKVPDKPVDLVDKLSQVIRTRKVEGRAVPEFEFTPRPLGGATGANSGQSVAQTSLSERALAALADAEKRLDALKPMQTPTDPENLEALRAVTLTTYKRLVNELGAGGGPRNKRAGTLFDVLIGRQSGGTLELKNDSLLKQIEDNFNLRSRVNTAEDSANLANFRIVKENLFDVFRSWSVFKGELEGDFSEQSARLSRTFVLLQDDVTDLEAVLDNFGYDSTDRESELLAGVPESDKITVDGLLSWIREFASEEGPEMLEGGGGIGIIATIPTLQELTSLAGELEKMLTPRFPESKAVEASLTSMKNRLSGATRLAIEIKTSAS
jgi:hypothetical protein